MIDSQFLQFGSLGALGKFEVEDLIAVENPGSLDLQIFQKSQGERNNPGTLANISTRAGLIEIKFRIRKILATKCGRFEIKLQKRNTPPFEDLEKRLLPLFVLKKDDEICAGND